MSSRARKLLELARKQTISDEKSESNDVCDDFDMENCSFIPGTSSKSSSKQNQDIFNEEEQVVGCEDNMDEDIISETLSESSDTHVSRKGATFDKKNKPKTTDDFITETTSKSNSIPRNQVIFNVEELDFDGNDSDMDKDSTSITSQPDNDVTKKQAIFYEESEFDDSDRDKDFIPNTSSESDSDIDHDKNKRIAVQKVKRNLLESFSEQLTQQSNAESIEHDPRQDHSNEENERIERTQTVTNNNRKKRPRKLEERMLNLKRKHCLRPPNCSCKENKCTKVLNETERERVYEEFWKLKKQEQRIWLSSHVKETKAKRKVEGSRRNFSRTYYLGQDNLVPVCQKFFLSSIGYTSTTVIDIMLKACRDEHGNRRLVPLEDQRGRHVPANKISETPIREHINSFKPKPSHYRRSHAPNRKYLPADLSIKRMYEDYLSKPNHKKVSYEVYRRNLDQMNIGFYEVGADKCGFCIEMDLNPTEDNLLLKEKHLEQVRKTREKYRSDCDLANQNPNIGAFAADLQKVFLLPRMPKVKESFFTSRLIVFNETFASLSKSKEHICILWHEAIAGRRAEDVACCFLKILELNRDAESIIFWLDNCSGQNKNSIFFSSLLTYVNSDFCTINSITINYLVSGHSYMAADGLHGKIEQVVRKTGNIEDFNDFIRCCQKSSKRMTVKQMQCTDFMKLETKFKTFNRKSENGMPYFKDIVSVKFVKGSKDFFYKTDFDEVEYKISDNILKKKVQFVFPNRTQAMRGISKIKKDVILKDLVPKMQANRKPFWLNLPENEESADLLEEGL